MREVNTEFLTPLTSEVKSKKFLVFDIESKDDASDVAGFTRPFMVGVYDGSYQSFWNERKLSNWKDYWKEGGCIDKAMRAILTRKYRGYHIYAHNAGRFDYLFILPWLMNVGRLLGFQFSIIPVSSSIQILDVWKVGKKGERHKNWRFLDSLKLIPVSLNKAAKSFGLGQKTEHDLNIPEADRESWIKYNKQDCWLNYAIVDKFHNYIEKVLLGEVGVTAPSTSMKLFRRRFLNKEVYRTKASHDFIRASYCGGRCEDFIKEGKDLFYFDINSSYPAAMLEKMPVGPGIHWQGNKLPKFAKEGYVGFVKCDVYVPKDINIPPLPIRSDGQNGLPKKLIFPVGNLSGIWEWDELQYAMSVGTKIKHIHESWWYQSDYIFTDFVNTLYAYRNTAKPDYDSGLSEVVKVLLNSLYGKFGMRTNRTKIYVYDDLECPDGARPAYPDPECEVMYSEEETDAEYIIPQISARITAIARVRLLKFMHCAESLGGKVYYCDTDSIITDVQLPTSSRLGDLKVEYPDYAGKIKGLFLGPKIYVLENEDNSFQIVKAKGFQERTREIIDRIYSGETIYNKKLEKIGGMCRNNFREGPVMLTVPRTVRNGIGKRIKNEDGTSRPYFIKGM